VTFTCGDIFAFAPTQEINNVISLETLEHLPNPHHFVKHIAAYMPKGGRFIASAPITPSMDANPYHLQDFTARSFRAMFEDAGFVELKHMIQVQPYSAKAVASKTDTRMQDMRQNLLAYYLTHPSKLYLRLRSVLVDGFCNKYYVGVFEKV
jgi:2-polyprenyl-3-methyl-5-hydroxy-6-metoxy-1,4-benzoquinol methylase